MKILVVCNNHNSMLLLELCASLEKRGEKIGVHAVCTKDFAAQKKDSLAVLDARVHVWQSEGLVVGRASTGQRGSQSGLVSRVQSALSQGVLHLFLSRVSRYLMVFSVGQYARELYIRKKIGRAKEKAEALLDEVRPSVILSMTDRTPDYLESSILWAGRKRRIRIVLPYVAHYDLNVATRYRTDAKGRPLGEHNPLWPFSLYKLCTYLRFRDQIVRGTFFVPSYVLNAHRKSGTLSRYPWWTGNGTSDVVCVNSVHMAKVYASHRVKPDKIRIVGDVFYDELFYALNSRSQLKTQIAKKYGFDAGARTLVLAMPQFAEQGLFDLKQHWREVEYLTQQLSETGCNLLISLHPRMVPREYAYLENRYRCRIAHERLSRIMPIADVFVAQNSSTVIWATLCGIKTVMIDFYGWNVDMFDYLETVLVVRDRSLLRSRLAEALNNSGAAQFVNDWAVLSRNEVFDGRTVERYSELLKS